jgi:hypothetical protein
MRGWCATSSAATVPHWPTDTRAQVVDSFLLKILAVEAAILIIVGLVAVIGHDDFVWLLR